MLSNNLAVGRWARALSFLCRHWPIFGILALFSVLFTGEVVKADTIEEIKEQVGFTKLQEALGSNIPVGAGVPISHVEARSNNLPEEQNDPPIYFPDTDFSQFLAGYGDPFSQDVTFIDASGGAANGESGHATTTVGQHYYGNTNSFAPGANTVTVYEANHWINTVLKLNGGTPSTHNFRVENFSWIGSLTTDEQNAHALGRFDYVIENNNLTAIVGSNTGGAPSSLLTHSLNALAVGVTSGSNPTNATESFYFPDRNKPEIVSPGNGSSATTANVASAATMLHESGVGTDTAKSETIKAILLAGATKEEFPGWSHSATEPLDNTFGAGELNVYNSYLIQSGGNDEGVPVQPAIPVGIDGWDYHISTFGLPLYYRFEVPVGYTATELSVVLAWNAKVTDSDLGSGFTPDVSLDNLNLRFYDSSNTFLDTEIAASISTVDNVEHLFLQGLSPGTYTLEVTNQTLGGSRDFGLAWRMETLLDDPSADFDEDGDADGIDFLVWQRNFGLLTGAAHGDGDADGDGDVDVDDSLYFTGQSAPLAGLPSAVGAIPEPGTIALGVLGLVILFLFRHSQRFLGPMRL